MIANLDLFESFQTHRYVTGQADIEGMPGIAEYAAQLYWRYTSDAAGVVAPPDAAVQEARKEIRELLQLTLAEYGRDLESADLDQRLRARLQMTGLTVRNPGIADLWIDIVQRLLERHRPQIHDSLGFDDRDVVAVVRYIYREQGARIARALRQGARLRANPFLTLGAVYRYSAKGLAKATHVRLESILAIFKLFGMRRGEGNDALRERVPTPSPYHDYMTRPLLIESDDSALVLTGIQLLWALLPRIEEAMAGNLKRSYLKHRSTFLEDETARLLRRLLGDESITMNVAYLDTAAAEQGEIDILARFDNSAYLFECKSEPLRSSVRRGAEVSFKNSLQAMIYRAYDQLVRAGQHAVSPMKRESLLNANAARLLHGTTEHEMVIVTLDHIGAIGGAVTEFRREGKFVEGFPWVVSLLELTMAVELLETGWNFKNYVRRRSEAFSSGDFRVWSQDELDFLGLYVATGHCVFNVSQETTFFPAPATLRINEYYDPLGSRRGEKPTLCIPASVKELFDRLNRERRPQWSEVVCDLLALHPASLVELGLDINLARKDAVIGHIVTKMYEGSHAGIGFVAGPSGAAADGLAATIAQFREETSATDIVVIVEYGNKTLFGWYSIDRSRKIVQRRGPLGTLLLQRPDAEDVGIPMN